MSFADAPGLPLQSVHVGIFSRTKRTPSPEPEPKVPYRIHLFGNAVQGYGWNVDFYECRSFWGYYLIGTSSASRWGNPENLTHLGFWANRYPTTAEATHGAELFIQNHQKQINTTVQTCTYYDPKGDA